jgi:hypothetical protein
MSKTILDVHFTMHIEDRVITLADIGIGCLTPLLRIGSPVWLGGVTSRPTRPDPLCGFGMRRLEIVSGHRTPRRAA